LVASLGDQRTSDQRINFSQSFNGLGGVIGPAIGSYCILKTGQEHSESVTAVRNLYMVIGIVIALLGLVFLFIKMPPLHSVYAAGNGISHIRQLARRKHFVFAVVAQFFNVAAQGGTWAYFINYGHDVMGLSDERSGYFFSLSIMMVMVGRFGGTALMRFIAPYKLLAIFAGMNILMCIIVAQQFGWVSFIALIMINFFFSIMFPTIFSLGLKDLGVHTQQASSFIVMGVVGGGIFPPLMGLIANHSVAEAYYLPVICYLVILLFGYSYPRLAKF
jgi:FHS family L-fucose permease-like MFS transporter